MTEAPKTSRRARMPVATVRVAMQEFLRRDSVVPVLRLLLDLAFLGACIVGACYFNAWWAKALMVVPASIAIARLFVIGHDACHGSYTKLRLAQQDRRPHRLPAVAHAVLALGRRPQRCPPRLHQPQGSRPGVGADVGRGVEGRFEIAPRARAHLSLGFRPGPLLHSSKCGGRSSSCPARNTSACVARFSCGTTCWC